MTFLLKYLQLNNTFTLIEKEVTVYKVTFIEYKTTCLISINTDNSIDI